MEIKERWRVEGGGWRVEGGGWRVEGWFKVDSIDEKKIIHFSFYFHKSWK
jgi:hypothetical protein